MSVFIYTVISFWKYILHLDFNSRLVWEDLLFKFSYRYGEKDRNSYRIFLVYLKSTFHLLFSKRTLSHDNKAADTLIFDISSKGKDERLNYLTRFTSPENLCFQAKEELSIEAGMLIKLWYSFLIIPLFIFVLFLSLFHKNKANLALIPLEFVELTALSALIKKHGIKKMLFFSAYEKDTCYISNYLMKHLDTEVQLIPSPNPISNFYQRVICTTFTFTVPYQKTEYEYLKNNWSVVNTVDWPPAGYTEILPTIGRKTTPQSIGYISSGNWLRKKLGHNDVGKGYFEAEENIIEILIAYLNKNRNIKLIVSLHPLEKNYIAETNDFYKEKFKDLHFEFAPADIKTREIPEIMDVAISAYSSAMFERLFAGYKVMFSQKVMKHNYFNDERLLKITANNQKEFDALLDNLLEISSDKYFEKYNLQEYSYRNFKELV